MKKILLTMGFFILALCSNAETKADTLVITTKPEMHCQGCENKIKQNIRFVKGIKKIETSVPQQKVTLIYDNRKTNYEAFVRAFKKIGYEIEKWQPKGEQ